MFDPSATRRAFLMSAASAAAARRAAGANERIRVGVVGTGGRGQYLMNQLLKIGGVDFPAVCDIYDVRRDQAAKLAGGQAEKYLDYRPLVERKDLDAVIVATPDHWHGTVAVDAMRAGKDVYIEKPMVHKAAEGQAIVRTARETRRVAQVGMQGRGLPQFTGAKRDYVDSGILGKIGLARTWYLSNAGYVQQAPPGMERKPDGLDWDRWLGPGPKVPWNPDIYFSPYKWLHYDGGMIMGIAIHVVDSAHHWLGLAKPLSCVAGGGTYFYEDGRDTPDVVTFILDYPGKVTVTFTAECLTAPGVRTSAGVELRATGGTLTAERYVQGEETAWAYSPNSKFSKAPAAKGPGTPASAEVILRNWVDCIRSRQTPVCNVEVAYYSTMACAMALEAFRTKERVRWNPAWDLPA
jgi:predicted dehydrogenase